MFPVIKTLSVSVQPKGRTIRKLMGGGRGTKKYSRKGKLNEKNSCTPINPEKYARYGLKKIQSRNLITKKIFLRFERLTYTANGKSQIQVENFSK